MTTRPNRVTRFAAVASLALAAMVAVPAVTRAADEARTDAPAARRAGGERSAQQRDPAGRLEMFRKSLDRLDLTDEQTTKVDAAFDKAKADLQNLDGSTDVRKRVEAFRDLRGKVMDALTPEQRRKFEQNLRTVRPGGGEGPMAGGGGQGLQRLRENAEKLGLTADQKKEIERISADTREKARQVMGDANGDREEARKQMGEVFRDAIQQIRETLTPEQQKKFRDLMEQAGADREGKSMAGDDDKMMADGDMMSDGDSAKGGKAKRAAATAAAAKPAAPKEPVDLSTVKFTRLDGRTVPISTYKGKPLVLVFGSYSCPSFREHAKGLDELQRRYAAKANFLLVYTKEAHPVGGWEVQRNKDAEISVPAAKDEAARLAAAKQARATLGLSMATAVDSMDDQLVAAFDAFPNGAVILDREGQIAARQKWAEPRGLRILLDNLNASPKTPATRASAD